MTNSKTKNSKDLHKNVMEKNVLDKNIKKKKKKLPLDGECGVTTQSKTFDDVFC